MNQRILEGRCMGCDYDLGGLPRVGHCPECGQAYDGDTRAGLANALASRQARQDRVLARVRTLSLLGLAVCLMLCTGGLSLVGWVASPLRALSIAALFAGLLGLAALVSFLSEREDP